MSSDCLLTTFNRLLQTHLFAHDSESTPLLLPIYGYVQIVYYNNYNYNYDYFYRLRLWWHRRFKSSQNRLIIDVNLYDEIDFVCPHYPSSSSPAAAAAAVASASDNQADAVADDVSRSPEYYVIYQVSQWPRAAVECNSRCKHGRRNRMRTNSFCVYSRMRKQD